jgi:hypothetical protein
MTPRFWHAVSLKIEPHKSRLLRAAAWSILGIVILFGGFAAASKSETWAVLTLWLVGVLGFWCLGVGWVTAQYRTLARRADHGFLGGWLWLMQWYGAVFFSLWFAVLIAMTLLAPVLIVAYLRAS